MDQKPKCKTNTTKLLEKRGINLHDFALNISFLDMTSKDEATKEKY